MDNRIPAWVNGTLMPVEKYEVHRKGLRHKAVSVFLLDAKDRILLQRRAVCKYHTPGLWANTCCTHPYWDEPSELCATRRLDEELGITGVPLEYRGQVEYRADVGSDLIEHEVVDLFTARAPDRLVINHNPEEVSETRWCVLSDLRDEIADQSDRFTPWLRIYLDRHRALIFPES